MLCNENESGERASEGNRVWFEGENKIKQMELVICTIKGQNEFIKEEIVALALCSHLCHKSCHDWNETLADVVEKCRVLMSQNSVRSPRWQQWNFIF